MNKITVRPISPNNLIQVIKMIEKDNKVFIEYKDEAGIIKESLATINKDYNQEYKEATIQDWKNFQEMLTETAVSDNKLKEIKEDISEKILNDISKITNKMSNPDADVIALSQELQNLTSNKDKIIEDSIEVYTKRTKEKARNRTIFHVGGIITKNNSIEIPTPSKKSRNLKTTYTNRLFSLFSFYNKKTNKPIKVKDISNIDFENVKLSIKISPINTVEALTDLFEINEHVLVNLEKNGVKFKNDYASSEIVRLISVTSKNDCELCTELKNFRNKYNSVKENTKILKKDINNLRKLYAELLKRIKKEGALPSEISLYLNIQTKTPNATPGIELRSLAERMLSDVNSNINALAGDYKKVQTFLNDCFFVNIVGMLTIPKIKENNKRVPFGTTFYIESQIGPNIEPVKESGKWCQGFISKQIENRLITLLKENNKQVENEK
jgi:hypothetical protein